jgi:phosphopentomutase
MLEAFFLVKGHVEYLGNMPVSGTRIINEIGDKQACVDFPISYTSNDSVSRIAAHQNVIPVESL